MIKAQLVAEHVQSAIPDANNVISFFRTDRALAQSQQPHTLTGPSSEQISTLTPLQFKFHNSKTQPYFAIKGGNPSMHPRLVEITEQGKPTTVVDGKWIKAAVTKQKVAIITLSGNQKIGIWFNGEKVVLNLEGSTKVVGVPDQRRVIIGSDAPYGNVTPINQYVDFPFDNTTDINQVTKISVPNSGAMLDAAQLEIVPIYSPDGATIILHDLKGRNSSTVVSGRIK